MSSREAVARDERAIHHRRGFFAGGLHLLDEPAYPIRDVRAAMLGALQVGAVVAATIEQALTQYGLERLLYKLSISEHAPSFLLKGALLFQLWYSQPRRSTRDADLLGFGPDDVPTLVGVFSSLCVIAVDGARMAALQRGRLITSEQH